MVEKIHPPQLVTNARMLYFCWVPADPFGAASMLPEGLEPAHNQAIFINQYVVDSDAYTSHFGAYSLTYMGLDLDGLDIDENTPGRYWTHYFNSNERMRVYAKDKGIPALSGKTDLQIKNSILVATTYSENGVAIIRSTVKISNKISDQVRGHLRYITLHDGQLESGRYAYVGSIDSSFEILSLEFLEPSHSCYKLRPADPLKVTFGFYSPSSSFCYPGGIETLKK